jgi:hypothetical protein
MADCVVTVPKRFGLQTWIDEGDPAGVYVYRDEI